MALKIVKGSIDRMFDKNLQDLVRGIRNHKEDEVKTTARANAGIRVISPKTHILWRFRVDIYFSLNRYRWLAS